MNLSTGISIAALIALFLASAWGGFGNSEFVFESSTPAARTKNSSAVDDTRKNDAYDLLSAKNIFEYGSGTGTSSVKMSRQKREVTYTAQGFDPAVLHAKAGEKIMFLNKSGRVFRLVSDTPDFPNGERIESGGSFSFVFQKKGEWSIGDADKTSILGIVSVE